MNEVSNVFVCSVGIGTVFAGLICIILLCWLMSTLCRAFQKKGNNAAGKASAPDTSVALQNRQEFIAAVSAAIAEDMGTDISAIRILSVKKV